jgi:hypothetical protein
MVLLDMISQRSDVEELPGTSHQDASIFDFPLCFIVHAHVLIQVTAGVELFVTEFTIERPYSRVDSLVSD